MNINEIKALVLPSSIEPSASTHLLSVMNGQIRLKQTLVALKKWRKSLPDSIPILIGDNTPGIDRLREAIRDIGLVNTHVFDVKPISQSDFARGGAGLSECNTILTIIRSAKLNESELVMKSNARYFILNWKLLLSRLSNKANLAVWPGGNLEYVETGFFIARVQSLVNGLPNVMLEIDETQGIFVEHLYPTIVQNIESELHFFQFPPSIQGVRGHTGRREGRLSEAYAIYAAIKIREQVKIATRIVRLRKPNS